MVFVAQALPDQPLGDLDGEVAHLAPQILLGALDVLGQLGLTNSVYGLVLNLVRRASGGPAELIGSSTSANSIPVVIASDQGAVPASQFGTWNIGTLTSITNTVTVAGDGEGKTMGQ